MSDRTVLSPWPAARRIQPECAQGPGWAMVLGQWLERPPLALCQCQTVTVAPHVTAAGAGGGGSDGAARRYRASRRRPGRGPGPDVRQIGTGLGSAPARAQAPSHRAHCGRLHSVDRSTVPDPPVPTSDAHLRWCRGRGRWPGADGNVDARWLHDSELASWLPASDSEVAACRLPVGTAAIRSAWLCEYC